MSEELNSKIMENETKPSNGKKSVTLLVVGIIILVAIIVFLVLTIFVSPNKEGSWSAVSLINGRTYFGQITRQNSEVINLENVHYLQMQQVPAQEEGQEPESQLSLMSIKEELHSPVGEMQINRDQVLFIQELKSDSQVVATIKQQLGE